MARAAFRASRGDRAHMQELPPSADDLPDTVSVNLDDKDPEKFEIVEVDDTPEADRGRPTAVDESLADQEADLRGLSQKTQKRIERLRFETHTERRGREAAERERDAAVKLAQDQNAEIARLRMVAESGNTALVGSMKAERETRIADATRRLEQAHIEGNTAALVKATVDLNAAQGELIAITTRTPAPQQQQPAPQQVQPAPQQQQNRLPPRVDGWINRNRDWFHVDGRDPKSAEALSIHYRLLAENVAPDSEAYTRELDKRLKAVYPDHQPLEFSSQDDGRAERSTPRRTNAVAESGREDDARRPANPRTVELTRSELSIAKQFGVTPQAYAVEKVRLDKRNGAK